MFSKIKLSIQSKIVLGYVFVILCLSWAVFGVSERIAELQKEIDFIVNHDIEVHNLVNQMEKNVLNMQSGQRSYVLTGNTSYLDLYANEMGLWEGNSNKLYSLVSGDPIQQKNLDAVKSHITEWINVAAEPAILLKKENKIQEIQDFYKADPGKNTMDQIRAQLESFRSAEAKLTADRTAVMDSKNTRIKTELLVYFLLISALTILIGLFISRSITKTIKQTIRAVKEISTSGEGKVSRIEVNSRDEVYDLALSMNELLGLHERHMWYQSRVSELAVLSIGVNDLNQLAQIYITKLATMVDAAYGVFYLRVSDGAQGKLTKVASYAAYGTEKGAAGFAWGEGLVGQAALENRLLSLDSIPDDYVKITSGLGQSSPKSILIAPVSYEGRVEAVIELASLEAFTTIQRNLIESATNNFGVILNNVEGRMEVERLLKESLALTQELQAQSEELQAQSEELQSQSEELQVQQEELRASNEQLEGQNESALQKARELQKAKSDLEKLAVDMQRNSAYKSEFLANMSHELRTPLNSIIILSQMLYENKNGTLSDEEKEYARVISSAGNDLLSLIDDILDLSKIEAGKIEILIDRVNVVEIPQLMNYSFAQLAQKKGIQFEAVLDEDIPNLLYTDGRRLQQILKNLLSNAFKFTEKGFVTLKIQKADPTVLSQHLTLQSYKSVLAISVTDTGVGIPKEMQTLIFDAFQQVDGTTNRRYGGTGLGLSICREFSKLLGGVIMLESEVNKGSTFTLYVPSMKDVLDRESTAAKVEIATTANDSEPTGEITFQIAPEMTAEKASVPVSPASTEQEVFKDKKVLLVDDDIRNVFALTIALENEGMMVKVASNGKEGLEVLREEGAMDLVLMDIMMPVMDGYEAMQSIRRMPQYADLPIIALTAKAMKSDREKCLESGASDYISKPLQIEQLFSLMRVWLTH